MPARFRGAVGKVTGWTARVLVYTACIAAPAEVQTQHIVDSSVKTGPVEPLFHLRVRTTPQGGGVSQVRLGPIFNFDLNDRATVITGYYYTRAKEEGDWSTTHRSFGGMEGVLWDRLFEVDARSLLEWHSLINGPDFTRFRNRVRITPPGKPGRYIGIEVFVDGEGWRSIRYSAGVRRKIAENFEVDIGYFYENGRSGSVADRHMITTTIHWRDRSTRADADP